jgi:dihydrofolate reductase
MIKAIVAVDDKWGMGKNGTLPWPKNSEDMMHFSSLTKGHIIVMGRKTWDDPCFPGPLPHRENVVVSSNTDLGVTTISGSIMRQIQQIDADSPKDVWLIGGRQILESYIDLVEELHITFIPGDYDCDVVLDDSILDGFELSQAEWSTVTFNQYNKYTRIKP